MQATGTEEEKETEKDISSDSEQNFVLYAK